MGNVELPDVGLAAELHALPEDLLHLGVLVQVPVDLGLGHQHRDVLGQGVLVVEYSDSLFSRIFKGLLGFRRKIKL